MEPHPGHSIRLRIHAPPYIHPSLAGSNGPLPPLLGYLFFEPLGGIAMGELKPMVFRGAVWAVWAPYRVGWDEPLWRWGMNWDEPLFGVGVSPKSELGYTNQKSSIFVISQFISQLVLGHRWATFLKDCPLKRDTPRAPKRVGI